MKITVGLGDFLASFSPAGFQRFTQAHSYDVTFTGAEANVLVSLSRLGLPTRFVTRVPATDIGDAALMQLNSFRVDTSCVARGGPRLGILYLEKGASQRPSKVIYDRHHSSICEAKPEHFDFDKIFEDAHWFHFTGITPALSDETAALMEVALKKAKEAGCTVSCDLNYRKNLWTSEKAKSVMEPLLSYVDVLIANEEDVEKVLRHRCGKRQAGPQRLYRGGQAADGEVRPQGCGYHLAGEHLRFPEPLVRPAVHRRPGPYFPEI